MNQARIVPMLAAAIIWTCLSSFASAATIQESLEFITGSKDYTEVAESDGVAVDLRYATSNNFVGKNLYGDLTKAFAHRAAADKLALAAANLQRIHPKYKLVVFDALRPRSVQYVLWDQVKGTEKQKYVANPKAGSIHNFGLAVDLSILDETGKELDMGTPYDDFTPLSQPQREEEFLKAGKLNEAQVKNRRLLRKVMEDAGFIQLPLEWWHFDALPRSEVKSKYKIVE